MGKITPEELARRRANLLEAQSLYDSGKRKVRSLFDAKRIREKQLQNKYGISLVEYEDMALEQESCCKICLSPHPSLVVDHCHQSGKVRGLLCQHCNSGLGFFRDNTSVLTRAVEYLQTDSILCRAS